MFQMLQFSSTVVIVSARLLGPRPLDGYTWRISSHLASISISVGTQIPVTLASSSAGNHG